MLKFRSLLKLKKKKVSVLVIHDCKQNQSGFPSQPNIESSHFQSLILIFLRGRQSWLLLFKNFDVVLQQRKMTGLRRLPHDVKSSLPQPPLSCVCFLASLKYSWECRDKYYHLQLPYRLTQSVNSNLQEKALEKKTKGVH